MKIKRISGLLIGTSAVLVSTLALSSCGNDITKEEFEKAYDSFIEEKKTTGYDLAVNTTSNTSEKNEDYEVFSKIKEYHVETYDAITSVLYTNDDVNNETKTPLGYTNESGRVEKIYQTDNGLNTIINVTKGTYTSLAYNASASKTRTSIVQFDNYVNYYSLVDTTNKAYTAEYFKDDSTYKVVISYDLSKDDDKEKKNGDVTIKKSEASYELTLQFYEVDSEFYIAYTKDEKYTLTTTNGSKTNTTNVVNNISKSARLFSVKQSIEPFDLTKYKKDYSSYLEQ